MAWIDDVERELDRARAAKTVGNDGQVRPSARRAAGYALTELQRRFPDRKYGVDFVRQLRGLMEDRSVAEEVRGAAERLQARLSADFASASTNPLEDARVIIAFVHKELYRTL